VRDFTLKKYESLIQAIKIMDYTPYTVYDFLKSPPQKCVILRHDVDREVFRNLMMARLEYINGIRSTYYFRHNENTFKPDVITQIAKMGHEIGFHYEVMDKANGDPKRAIEIFQRELDDFRKVTENITEIHTVCMHGNPLKPWSNRDLWEKYDFRDFGIDGEPYFSIDYNKVFYLTDTGRTWADRKIRVKDTIDRSDAREGADLKAIALTSTGLNSISTTDDVIQLIQSQKIPQICLLVHPNRWCDDFGGWTKELLFQNVKNVGKAGIIWYRSKAREKAMKSARLYSD
jgi:hypothetical protein